MIHELILLQSFVVILRKVAEKQNNLLVSRSLPDIDYATQLDEEQLNNALGMKQMHAPQANLLCSQQRTPLTAH